MKGDMDCLLCDPATADRVIGRQLIWEDPLWRLTTSVGPQDYTPGFSYLEPRRHIRTVAELDGAEAATLGGVLARATAALREAAEAQLVYVYIFGEGIAHLHIHLAPHVAGDALSSAIIRGELVEQTTEEGLTLQTSTQFAPVPEERLREVAERARRLLAG
jgi:diadenosine tetraphosphate (Ap4A) HIT family hydrolase